jgi:hypothetical protein
MIGGTLTIDAAPGSGVRLLACAPLADAPIVASTAADAPAVVGTAADAPIVASIPAEEIRGAKNV